jgi:hypothetical protein
MKLSKQIYIGLLLGVTLPVWSQVTESPAQPVAAYGQGSGTNGEDRMQPPPPVSGQSYPTTGTSAERSNYLRGGLAFTTAYTDNALGSTNGQAISEISYSIAPFVELDETTTRLHMVAMYAPGFTFYQKTSGRNEADQNASIDFQYRLTQHLTFSARDGFQKSSNVFNQPFLGQGTAVSGATQQPNFSVIAPIASFLSNSGNVGISWQFAANGMAGASGTFSNLQYSNESEVSGLSNSNSQAGSIFYSRRFSKMHYIGASYQYQRLIANLNEGQSETQTQAILLFYTLYASPRLSLSFFGGPQHSDTVQPPIPPSQIAVPEARSWTPAYGVSMGWQGQKTSLALSYSHIISGGGGLMGAVQMSSVGASLGQQFTSRLNGSIGFGYTKNDVLGSALAASSNGRSFSGTASLQQQLGQHLNMQLGYTRLHQDYTGVAVLAANPDTNREFVSLSYQFSRPLGR